LSRKIWGEKIVSLGVQKIGLDLRIGTWNL
jgi:hypothetical protein